MAFYQVEGTSLIRWSLLVEARSESEASDSAVRLAGGGGDLRQGHALLDVRHQVNCARRLIDAQAQDRPSHGLAGQRGDE